MENICDDEQGGSNNDEEFGPSQTRSSPLQEPQPNHTWRQNLLRPGQTVRDLNQLVQEQLHHHRRQGQQHRPDGSHEHLDDHGHAHHDRTTSEPLRKTMLQGRLEELRFLILYDDGRPAEYRVMSLRNLYNYVMKNITAQPKDLTYEIMSFRSKRIMGKSMMSLATSTSTINTRATPTIRPRTIATSSIRRPASPSSRPRSPPRGANPGTSYYSQGRSSYTSRMVPGSPTPPPPPPPLTLPNTHGQHTMGTPHTFHVTENPRPPPPPPPPLLSLRSHLHPSESERTSSNHHVVSLLPPVNEDAPSTPQPVPDTIHQSNSHSNTPTLGENPHQEESGENVVSPTTTYRERLGGYLHPRDMRRIVTPFSSTNEPELIVRRHVMLLNFDKLRAIVLRDRLLVRVPDGADSMLMTLEKRVRGGTDAVVKEVFGSETEVEADAISDSVNLDCMNVSEVQKEPFLKGYGGGMGRNMIRKGSPGVRNEDSTDDLVLTKYNNKTGGGKDDNDTDKYTTDETADETGSGGSRDDNENETKTLDWDPNKNEDNDDESPVFLDDNEWDDIDKRDWIELPFELQCVDAVLYTVCEMLSEEAFEVRRKAYVAMALLVGDTHRSAAEGHAQEKLRMLKDEVKEMEGRVKAFVRALDLVLDDDEDMALMNLSRLITHPDRFIQPVSEDILHEESDEPELILEAYMQQALSTVNGLEQVTSKIATTEELVAMKLDTLRNRLLYVNTLVSLMSLCVASASLVGSIFGMNLTNHLETNENAFKQVVTGTVIGAFMMLIMLLLMFDRAGKLPRGGAQVSLSDSAAV